MLTMIRLKFSNESSTQKGKMGNGEKKETTNSNRWEEKKGMVFYV